jgi:2-phospho-L-lactate guanylyltransferase
LTPLAVLIPVKSSGIKSRLSGILSRAERKEFARLLLLDVLGAFRQAGLLKFCHVVSADEGILALVANAGAHPIREQGDSGVNSAVNFGIRATGRPRSVLVVPSDLPLLGASDVEHLLALRSAGLDVVIAPSLAFDGTNALAFSGTSGFPLSYDNDSFWNHTAAVARRGLSLGVCSNRGVMFDVDSPDDFRMLAKARVNRPSAVFARRVLR